LHALAPGAVIELARRGVSLRRMEAPSEPPRTGTELVALSALTPEAGVHRLLEAFAIARARGLGARLTVFGEGPQHGRLLRLVAALRLETSVRIVPPAAALEAHALRNAQAVIAPALDEASAQGAALAAAFASGRPAIASDVPTHRELLQPDAAEPNGWLVTKDDPRALALALEAACSDPLGARRRGRQARRFAERVLDLEHNARARAERLFAAAYPGVDPRVSSAQRAQPRSSS
jgi:glycosyltransferase involved in cell wall biosynthesis